MVPASAINRDEVEQRRDRLQAEYGEVPVVEWRETIPTEQFGEWVELARDGYLGSAYAFIRRTPADLPPLSETMAVDGPERERVLLILGRGASDWGVPGGGQEDEERLEATAVREVREEVGLDVTITGLDHLRHEIGEREDDDATIHALRAFFRATYDDGTLRIQPGELNGAAWFANPPASERLLPSTERLLDGWKSEDSA